MVENCKEKLTLEMNNEFNKYLIKNKVRKLQIGSGSNVIDGWFNTDINIRENIYYLDLKKKFLFSDNIFDYIYSEHSIEHFTVDEGVFLLKECFRVLKHNGRIRIATPGLKNLINYYNCDSELHNKYTNWEFNSFIKKKNSTNICTKCVVINNFYRDWGHKFIYDFETLKKVLEYSGFTEVYECEILKSTISDLCGLERHLKKVNFNYNIIETMVVEAVKY